MDILQVKNLTFSYLDSKKPTIEAVSFAVKAGEFILLCGESGCGKSTLLRLLKRELAPFGKTEGEIFYNGRSQYEIDKRTYASDIGFVLQNPETQIVTDKVWHELAFGLENLGLDNGIIRRRVSEMASYFGIEDWYMRDTANLSGGQKQMLNLASAMVMQPKILLLDEPTAQLDPIAAANFIATLKKLNDELGLTIILVEHRLEEVFSLVDRVFLMSDGKLVFNGEPRRMPDYFEIDRTHKMIHSLPAAMQIFRGLEGREEAGDREITHIIEESPVTVKEGRQYIMSHYNNRICNIEEIEGRDSIDIRKSGDVVLELKDVLFRYEKNSEDVLKGVSLKVYKGEKLCILGRNGTGKSTTLSIMAGLLRSYKGNVLVGNRKISKLSDAELHRNNIAMLPQNPELVFVGNTVREDFIEICKVMEYKKNDIEKEISCVAKRLDIEHLLEHHPYDLSGGEIQKAALAKMLLLKPKILLLDEPTKGIDASSKLMIKEILEELVESGITIVIVTHDVEFAALNSDRCALFFGGEIVSLDKPREFFSGNNFYTTAANRIAKDYYKNAISVEDIVYLCKVNGRKAGEL